MSFVLIAHCMRRLHTVRPLRTVPRLSLLFRQSCRLQVGKRVCGEVRRFCRLQLSAGSEFRFLSLLFGSEGSFQETAPRKTAENTVKHHNGGVGSEVANHRDGSDSSVVVTTLTWCIHGQNRCVQKRVGHFLHKPGECRRRPPTAVGVRKLRVPVLSRGFVCMILGLAILVEHPTCVRQMVGQTHGDGKCHASLVSHG